YQTIQEDRFGDAAKAARQAHRDGIENESGHHDYPNLAIQKLGGTKPQNISQLNSERRGDNYLLASLPPDWKSLGVKAPLFIESVFQRRYGVRDEVRNVVRNLRTFLLDDPPANVATRNRVERDLDALIGELVMFAAELHGGLQPGYSRDPNCRLVEVERLWLDPGRAELEGEEEFLADWAKLEWPDEIGRRFGNWLNHALGPDLPLGDIEQRQWRNELLLDEEKDGWAWTLRRQRQHLDMPTYGPVRRAWR
ncbi:MAG: type I-F CRISPR-associated protein Csy1, partial [Rhodanobacteraceae bacterium]